MRPFLVNEIFTRRVIPENSVVANLRSRTDFYNYHNPQSVRFGKETLRAIGLKIWNIIPPDIKNSLSLAIFKRKIKKGVPVNCPCGLLKVLGVFNGTHYVVLCCVLTLS